MALPSRMLVKWLESRSINLAYTSGHRARRLRLTRTRLISLFAMPLINQVIPSSSPVVTPIKTVKKRKLSHCEPERLFEADSPQSIHSSDADSYSSQLLSQYPEPMPSQPESVRLVDEPPCLSEDLPILAPSSGQSQRCKQPAQHNKPISSSQEELEDIILLQKENVAPPELDNADITIDSDGESYDTQWYARQYCTESVLSRLF